MKRKLLAISCGMILFPMLAWGNNYAVRPDCPINGNGSNWACAVSGGGEGAFNTIPTSGSITRGDAIYFGDGTITLTSSYKMDKPINGTMQITFRKATVSDYGGLANWVSTYGDGDTIFTSTGDSRNVVFSTRTGYYTLDGVRNSGSNPNGYGFKVIPGSKTPTLGISFLIFDEYSYAPPGYTIKNVAFVNLGAAYNIEQVCLYGGYKDLSLQKNYFGESQNFIHGLNSNVIIENNYFKNNWSSSSHHGEAMSVCPTSGFIVRNNTFYNAVNGTTGIGCQSGTYIMNDWKIYNNIVVGGSAGNGFVSNNEVGTTTLNLKVYNNTFVDTNATVYIKGSSSSGNKVINNLYYNASGSDANCTGCSYSYNYYTAGSTVPASAQPGKIIDTSDPFVSKSTMDYRLLSTSKAKAAGIDLGVTYNIDFFGVLRPAGMPWDIGAIQGGFAGGKLPFWPVIAPIN